jgi:hypothetical protein
MNARHNLYREVHKGVRSLLLDVIVKSGRVDWTDAGAVALFRTDLQNAFALLSEHAEHEERFIEPVLAAEAPEVASILGAAHEDQEVQLHELLTTAHEIDSASGDAAVKGHQLVLRLSRIAGEMLTHMADEEEIAMPAMWARLDDAAILDVHQRLVGSIPPEKMERNLRLMLPAMNTTERVEMLSGIRHSAPPPVFGFVRALAAEVLAPEDNAALDRGMNTLMEVQS